MAKRRKTVSVDALANAWVWGAYTNGHNARVWYGDERARLADGVRDLAEWKLASAWINGVVDVDDMKLIRKKLHAARRGKTSKWLIEYAVLMSPVGGDRWFLADTTLLSSEKAARLWMALWFGAYRMDDEAVQKRVTGEYIQMIFDAIAEVKRGVS